MTRIKPALPILQKNEPLAYRLRAGWAFYEGQGSTIRDLGPERHDADVGVDPIWSRTGGPQGGPYGAWDGSDDEGLCGTLGDFGNRMSTCTVSFWIRFTDGTTSPGRIMGATNTGDSTALLIQANRDNAGDIELFNRDSSTGTTRRWFVTASGGFNDGEWHHVVMICRTTFADSRIFVDGVSQSLTNKDFDSINPSNFDVEWELGGINDGVGGIENLQHDTDNVLLWDRPIADQDARTLFEQPWILWTPRIARTPIVSVAPADTVTVTDPVRYQTYQRNGSDQADIPITGTYTGTPTAIEASFNGGAFATIDASPTGGNFSGTLSNQSAGQGTLTVRFTNDTGITDTVDDVGIGDVFVVAGQSNAEGRGNSSQSYSHATLKATVFRQDDAWADGNDPTDTGTSNGSPWPLLATSVMANTSVPVAFITTAEGATGLVNPTDWQKPNATYNDCLQTIQNSNVNDVKAILWHQGESDANNAVSAADYETELSTFVDNIQTDTGFTSMKLIVANLGFKTTGGVTRDNLDAIRQGQLNAAANDADILSGPILYDVDLSGGDGVHFATNGELQELADRWWRMVEFHFFSGTDGRGPQFSSASYTGSTVTVLLSGGIGSLTGQTDTTGWRVEDNGTPATINSAAANGPNGVDLTLASAPTGPVTVSFGSFNDGAGTTLDDSGATPLPPEPFVDEAVTTVLSIGLATETDTALPAVTPKAIGLGVASESDSAFAATLDVRIIVGQAVESDTALPVTMQQPGSMPVGLATETDTALPVTMQRTVPLGVALESDTASSTSVDRTIAIGLASETETALATTVERAIALGLATETDTALGVSVGSVVSVGIATEAESAQAVTARKTVSVGLASETDTALSLGGGGATTIQLGVATETSSALAAFLGSGVAQPWSPLDVKIIEQAMSVFLVTPTDGDTTNGTRQRAREEVATRVGPHVFSGRKPKGTPEYALTVRRIQSRRFYNLTGEQGQAAPTLQVDVWGRDERAGLETLKLAEYVRIALSGYRGNMDGLFVHGCTIERDVMQIPTAVPDGSDLWAFRYSLDVRVTHDQVSA